MERQKNKCIDAVDKDEKNNLGVWNWKRKALDRRKMNGNPKNRWIVAVDEDAKKNLGVRNWKRKTVDRQKMNGKAKEYMD
ncbi:hypothetical protein L9F63_000378 [Diploptera punctata]|uniref:Uncharacterized protein n=1 Tax=Diploptera punctata TaxID=6984 RepID=A0AAD8ALW8_DIPPU|nr:hypothetical protein L9F63_000378 [Diploptera punctata]